VSGSRVTTLGMNTNDELICAEIESAEDFEQDRKRTAKAVAMLRHPAGRRCESERTENESE